jgi:hypothetical protein
MPAVSNRETIPNSPLNGHELAIYSRTLLAKTLQSRNWTESQSAAVLDSFEKALANEWMFKPTYLFANVQFEISVESHSCEETTSAQFAFTLEIVFRTPKSRPPLDEVKPFVRRPVGVPAPPLESFGPNALHLVDCFTIKASIENPNLVRVHCGMPIIVTEKIPPKHGDLFGTIKNHEIRYDPAGYEPLPDPTVTDQSKNFSQKWGVKNAISGVSPADAPGRDTANQEESGQSTGGDQYAAGVNATGTPGIGIVETFLHPSEQSTPLAFPKPPRRDRGHK